MKNWKKKSKIQSIIFLVSCYEAELKIELPAPEQKLVVHSIFTPFTPPAVKSFTVSVSQNAGVFDTLKMVPIADATVSLFVDGKFDQILKYSSVSGHYWSYFYPKAGVEYSISVEKQGFETVTAKGTIPPKVPIKGCELIPFAGLDQDGWAFSKL